MHIRGQVTWSECTRNVTKTLWETKKCLRDHTKQGNLEDVYALDHSRYHDLPGREWTAKAQCELFFRNKDANVVTLHDICQTLECEIPPNEISFTGPALDGMSLLSKKKTFLDILIFNLSRNALRTGKRMS